jgi:hypothetical protein
MDNKSITILASAVRAATNNSANQNNYGNRGVHVIVDVTAAPGVDTVTPKIQGYDPVSGTYYDLVVGAAIVAASTVVLKVYPGITVAANLSVSDFLPLTWRVVMTHSAGTNFTYSVAANLV